MEQTLLPEHLGNNLAFFGHYFGANAASGGDAAVLPGCLANLALHLAMQN
jgi:hypothetical protein